MWNVVLFPVIGLSLLAGGLASPAIQKAASGPVTYWQENRCLDRDLGDGAVLRWCVESLVVNEEGSMEVHVSWTCSGLAGNRLFKESDANNHGMYLLDDLGKRYDAIDTREAARNGGRLDSEHPVLRGVFVFPPPGKDAKSFTFRDDDQKTAVSNLMLSPHSRTDPATSGGILGRLMHAETLRIDARRSGAKEEAHEQYSLRLTPTGFRLESDSRDPGGSVLVIPPPVMELFLQSLSESPLLERRYEPQPAVINDYPAITLDLRTEQEDVIFFSRPEGDRFAPWRAETRGKVYLVPDDSPLRSLEILDPFLERDPKSRAMRLLSPHVGEERANELWARLEGPLGAEEALRVTRRLEDLLSRDVEESEIWLAVDEYLAQASPPETPSTKSTTSSPAPEVADADLLAAVRSGDAGALRSLLSAGADPGTRGRDGKTALMLAAESGQTETLQALLDSGAKPDVQTLRGDTALALAARNKHRGSVRILLHAGANPKLEDSHGSTALMETTDAEIARTLIRGGAEVNAVDDRGLTPMMRLIAAESSAASSGERAEMLQSLLTAGADVRARDREGRTALIWAIKGTPSTPSYSQLAGLLIEAGSEVDARDREGGTPLVYAAVRGDERSVRLLIDAGADVNAHMGNLSALDIALRYGHPEIVALLLRVGARR